MSTPSLAPSISTLAESAQTLLNHEQIHNFKGKEGRQARAELSVKMEDLNKAVDELYKSHSDSEVGKSYDELQPALTGLNGKITDLDAEIKTKTTPKWWQYLLFWTLPKKENPVPTLNEQRLSSAFASQRQAYLSKKVEKEPQNIELRINEVAVSGTWAVSKATEDGKFVLHVYKQDHLEKMTIDVAPEGYKVKDLADRTFKSFDELLQASSAKRTLSDQVLIHKNRQEIIASLGGVISPDEIQDKIVRLEKMKASMGAAACGIGFLVEASDKRLSVVYIDKDQQIKTKSLEVLPETSAKALMSELDLEPFDQGEARLQTFEGFVREFQKLYQAAADPNSDDVAKITMQQAVAKLVPREGRYCFAPRKDTSNDWRLFVETKDKTVTEYQVSIDRQAKISLTTIPGNEMIGTFGTLAEAKEKAGIPRDGATAVQDFQAHAKELIASTQKAIEQNVKKSTTSSQQPKLTQELEKICKGLQKEAVGTAFRVQGSDGKQYLVFVDKDLVVKSRRIDIYPDRIVLSGGADERVFASFDAMNGALAIKDFDAMDALHRERNAKISDAKAGLQAVAIASLHGGGTQSVTTQEQATKLLQSVISSLGDNANGAYLIFETDGNMFLSFVKDKQVVTKPIDVTSQPGNCLVTFAEGKTFAILEKVPSRVKADALMPSVQKAAKEAGISLSDKNDWAKACEEVKKLRTNLLLKAGTSKDVPENLSTEFAGLLGSLGFEACVGAFTIYSGERKGQLYLERVSKEEGEAAKNEVLQIDLGKNPGKIVVGEEEYDTIVELASRMNLTKPIAKLRQDRDEQVSKAKHLIGDKDYDVNAHTAEKAKQKLEPLVAELKDAGIEGGYLFRSNATTKQQAAFNRGQLTQVESGKWSKLWGGVKGLGAGLGKVVDFATLGTASYALGTAAYGWQRYGYGKPATEFMVSIYRKNEKGDGYVLDEYAVPIEGGKLKYGNEGFDTLPQVYEAIKKDKKLPDLKSLTDLQALKVKVESHEKVIINDNGYNGGVGLGRQFAKGTVRAVSAVASYIPKLGTYAPWVLVDPPQVANAQEAEKLLDEVYGHLPDPIYMMYPSAEKTDAKKQLYPLSAINANGAYEHFLIDPWTDPGKYVVRKHLSNFSFADESGAIKRFSLDTTTTPSKVVVRDSKGNVVRTEDGIEEAIARVAGGKDIRRGEGEEMIAVAETLDQAIKGVCGEQAKPFKTQWYEYQSKQLEKGPTLALTLEPSRATEVSAPTETSAAVSTEAPAPTETVAPVSMTAEKVQDQIVRLRHLVSLQALEKAPSEKSGDKILWLALRDVKNSLNPQTKRTQSRKALRYVGGLPEGGKVILIKENLHHVLYPAIHPDKGLPDGGVLTGLVNDLTKVAELP